MVSGPSRTILVQVSALVDAYLSHLAVERRLSPNTVESYGRDLSLLRQFAAGLTGARSRTSIAAASRRSSGS